MVVRLKDCSKAEKNRRKGQAFFFAFLFFGRSSLHQADNYCFYFWCLVPAHTPPPPSPPLPFTPSFHPHPAPRSFTVYITGFFNYFWGLQCTFYVCVCVDLPLAGNSGKCAGTDSYQCVQYFYVCKEWYGCQCLEFLSCAQMLMHATARVVCTNSVTESALKVDPGRKTGGEKTKKTQQQNIAVRESGTNVSIASGVSVCCFYRLSHVTPASLSPFGNVPFSWFNALSSSLCLHGSSPRAERERGKC